MRYSLALSTRIGVAILVSLTLVTAAVTAFVISNPDDARAKITLPAEKTPGPTPSGDLRAP